MERCVDCLSRSFIFETKGRVVEVQWWVVGAGPHCQGRVGSCLLITKKVVAVKCEVCMRHNGCKICICRNCHKV